MGFNNKNNIKKGLNICEYNNVNGIHQQLGRMAND